MSTEKKGSSKGSFITPGYTLPFILVTSLFFMWAIPHNLNDVLIKQSMKVFAIDRMHAGFIQTAFYLGYFIFAIPAAVIMRKYNYKTGLVIGLFIYSFGCLLFLPAALISKYFAFLVALFVIASGLSFLETGANPFIAGLGDPSSSERRLNFSQAFNPFGAITGASIGTIFILSGREPDVAQIEAMKLNGTYDDFVKEELWRIVPPYMVLAGVVLILAILMIRTKFPRSLDEHADEKDDAPKGRISELFKVPHFIQAVIAQFLYVGAQVGTWSYFIQYVQDYTGSNEKLAGYLLTGTLAAFALGRFSATWFMKFIKPNKLMGFYSIINIMLVSVAILKPGALGMWSLFITSFFMSLMFPTIFALGIKDLGTNTKLGGSLLVMSIIGGAVFPPIMGKIYQMTHSMAISMILPCLSYIFIAYFSFFGAGNREVRIER
ncbi:MAG TPA: L-fucose:H+ symporter permease [Bacteroidales bacterium]|nr:L-fucose:H+ symporter permease [Bacteroidales bacterium]HOU96731.1 L-fucose:H+ symporter permease [Bacteroidales bacterium]HQG37308.1 L-fucose:H+ symporter permease [Bacteroidales bacterium]HQG53133.1 L-fucose:H+ symporter permease [Bacteroidales bacterium]HQJ21635.1 L-fucose:H+ symporter permease [Bacteroidales bacterium]